MSALRGVGIIDPDAIFVQEANARYCVFCFPSSSHPLQPQAEGGWLCHSAVAATSFGQKTRLEKERQEKSQNARARSSSGGGLGGGSTPSFGFRGRRIKSWT